MDRYQQSPVSSDFFENILAVLLLLSLYFTSFLTFKVDGVRLGVVDTGLFLVFCFISLKKKYDFNGFIVASLVFVLLMTLSTLLKKLEGEAGYRSILLCARLALIFSIIGAGIWASENEFFEKKIYIYSVFLGLITVCFLSIVLFYLNIALSKDQQIMWFSNGSHHVRAGGTIGNTGAFGHQIYLLYALSIFIFFSAYKDKFFRALSCASIPLTFFDVVISSSRGGFLGIIVFSFIFFLGIGLKDRIRFIFLLFAGMLAATLIILLSLDSKIIEYSGQRIGMATFYKKNYEENKINPDGQDKNNNSAYSLYIDEEKLQKCQKELDYKGRSKKPSYSASENDYDCDFHPRKDGSKKIDSTSIGDSQKSNMSQPGLPDETERGGEQKEELKKNIDNLSSGRFAAWRLYYSVIKNNLLMGVGYKNSINYYGILIDNSFLSVLIEGGLVSFFAYFLLLVSMIFVSFVIYFKSDKKNGVFLIAFVLSNIVQSIFLDMYSQWISLPIFLFIFFVVGAAEWRKLKRT